MTRRQTKRWSYLWYHLIFAHFDRLQCLSIPVLPWLSPSIKTTKDSQNQNHGRISVVLSSVFLIHSHTVIIRIAIIKIYTVFMIRPDRKWERSKNELTINQVIFSSLESLSVGSNICDSIDRASNSWFSPNSIWPGNDPRCASKWGVCPVELQDDSTPY